jgi:REP element-mobilizing transposase RayT
LTAHFFHGLTPDLNVTSDRRSLDPAMSTGLPFARTLSAEPAESSQFTSGSSRVSRAAMARPLRIQCAGLTYHVTSRGVRRSAIYLDDQDRRHFLQILADVVERYDLRCHAYCEMTNHYHLALTTLDANLSRAMHQLNGDYAQWWNWRHNRVGHVLEARFTAQIIQDDRYLANVCRYIVLNPVRARMASLPEEWPWSSYRATIGLATQPAFLDLDRLSESMKAGDPGDGRDRFRQFVQGVDTLTEPFSREAILGDDEFIARFRPYRERAGRDIPRAVGRRSLSAIFQAAVTRAARNAAVMIAVRERYTLADIARFLEVHPSTVSKIVSAMRGQTVKKPSIHDLAP